MSHGLVLLFRPSLTGDFPDLLKQSLFQGVNMKFLGSGDEQGNSISFDHPDFFKFFEAEVFFTHRPEVIGIFSSN